MKFARNVMKEEQHKNYQDEDKKSAVNKKILTFSFYNLTFHFSFHPSFLLPLPSVGLYMSSLDPLPEAKNPMNFTTDENCRNDRLKYLDKNHIVTVLIQRLHLISCEPDNELCDRQQITKTLVLRVRNYLPTE